MAKDEPMILLNTLAKQHGIKPHTARAAARAGKLKATPVKTEIGHIWKTTRADFEAWVNDARAHQLFGRPPKIGG